MAVTVDKVSASTAAFLETSKQADVERKRISAETAKAFEAVQSSPVLASVPDAKRGWISSQADVAPSGCGTSTTRWAQSRFEIDAKAEPVLAFSYRCGGDRQDGYLYFNNRLTLSKSAAVTAVTQNPAMLDVVDGALEQARADLKPYVGPAKPAVVVVIEKE